MDIDNVPIDFEGHVSHTAQAAPITVQWLIDNFEPAEGCSLRRSTLYNYYLHHCTEQKIEPVNPASFGKLIRSVFLGLRTRRLGTRGNSKYHYYGIRVKANSPLNQIADDQALAIRNHPLCMSPTGSPQPPSHNNHSSSGGSSNANSTTMLTVNGNGPSPSKKAKQAAAAVSSTNNSFNYETNVEYKPIITNVLTSSENNQHNNGILTTNNQSLLQASVMNIPGRN